MRLSLIVCLAGLLGGCGSAGVAGADVVDARTAYADAVRTDSVPAAGYDGFRLSEEKIVALEERASSGEKAAFDELVYYFRRPYSLPHPRGMAWLKAGAEAGSPAAMQSYAIHLERDEAGCREAVFWSGRATEAAISKGFDSGWIENARSWEQAIQEQCRKPAS